MEVKLTKKVHNYIEEFKEKLGKHFQTETKDCLLDFIREYPEFKFEKDDLKKKLVQKI